MYDLPEAMTPPRAAAPTTNITADQVVLIARSLAPVNSSVAAGPPIAWLSGFDLYRKGKTRCSAGPTVLWHIDMRTNLLRSAVWGLIIVMLWSKYTSA